MNFGLSKYRGAVIQSRTSPISRPAILLTVGLAAIGIIASIATKFTVASLPNIAPFILGIVGIDVLSQFAPQTRIVEAVQAFIYGVMYLVVTCLCGVVAAYALQRFAFPLQDRNLASADLALGLNWQEFAHWVDSHAAIQNIFYYTYDSIACQIALPLLVLVFAGKPSEVRIYLLAFTIAFVATIIISALMPAVGPIVFADRASFHLLQFTGATPLDQLMRLREAGPLILRESPGGIATFPSFHATIAVLTPLTLRRYRRTFAGLLILNTFMLGATVTEGAHYFIDVIAGSAMAFFAYALAARIIRMEDRTAQSDLRAPAAQRVPAPSG
jgi:membrane-associated phospholipid phosphatase